MISVTLEQPMLLRSKGRVSSLWMLETLLCYKSCIWIIFGRFWRTIAKWTFYKDILLISRVISNNSLPEWYLQQMLPATSKIYRLWKKSDSLKPSVSKNRWYFSCNSGCFIEYFPCLWYRESLFRFQELYELGCLSEFLVQQCSNNVVETGTLSDCLP